MREIKFRAWNKITKKMYLPFDLNWCIEGTKKPDDWEHDGVLSLWNNGVIFLEYTGLKDKNGKEIYEGDILNRDYNRNKNNYYIVIFDDGGFCFYSLWAFKNDAAKESLTFCQLNINSRKLKVIGNIYENPDLLK